MKYVSLYSKMWVAKIKINGVNALLGNLAKACCVSATGYPIHTYEKKDALYTDFVGFLFGTEENQRKAMDMLSKSPRIANFEKDRDFIVARIQEPLRNSFVYQYDIIHLEPVVIREDGTEFWTIGAWEKDRIMNFIDAIEETIGAEVMSVQQKSISNFAMINIQPNFSPKQKLAMGLAIKHGYYDYPRGTTIEHLAGIGKLSYSTFQAHLRKAENKFFPFCYSRFYD